MKRKALYVTGTLLATAILAFGYYAISPLFIYSTADDALPSSVTAQGEVAAVIGTIGHPASGVARIVEAEGKTYVRYENLKSINGPDIFVYLAKDLDAKEFVNLGKVRATEGNVNYGVPAEVDVSEYRYVLTWCRAFGVLFNYAELLEMR